MTQTQKRKCLLVSFNFSKEKDGYPPISYQIASILAQFKEADYIDIDLFDYDMNGLLEQAWPENEKDIIDRFDMEYKHKINEYSFIALSVYAWSEDIVKQLIEKLRNSYKFGGKIILGGYEITAREDEAQLQNDYPGADYYVQRYAEKAFEMIFRNKAESGILSVTLDDVELESPYVSGILPLTKKIYWETKRGCQFTCDFCEWGTAARNIAGKGRVIRLGQKRLDAEMELFKNGNIEEIKILDASFISSGEDVKILENLLAVHKFKIVLEAHFAFMKKTDLKNQLIEICKQNRDRISLELGLQTIIEEEMKILKRERDNDLEHIKKIMAELNKQKINYEISIIYGIPGQTADTFKKTIKFIVENGCTKFRAFPLRLPFNSEMKKQAKESGISEDFTRDNPLIKHIIKTKPSTIEEAAKFLRENKGATIDDFLKSKGIDSFVIGDTYGASNPYNDYEKMRCLASIGDYGLPYSRGQKPRKDISELIDDFNSYILGHIFDERQNELRLFIEEYLRDGKPAKAPYIDLISLTPFVPAVISILKAIRELSLKKQNTAYITKRIFGFIEATDKMIWRKLATESSFKEEEFFLEEFTRRIGEVIRLRGSDKIDLIDVWFKGWFNDYYGNFDKAYHLIRRFIETTYKKSELSMAYHDKAKKHLGPTNDPKEFRKIMRAFLYKWRRLFLKKRIGWVQKIIEDRQKEFGRRLKADLTKRVTGSGRP